MNLKPKKRPILFLTFAVAFLISLIFGQAITHKIRHTQLQSSLESITAATLHDSSAFDIDSYSRLVYSMVRSFAGSLGTTARDSTHVAFCQENHVLVEIPKLSQGMNQKHCTTELKISFFFTSAWVQLNQFSEPLRIEVLYNNPIIDPLAALISLLLFFTFTAITYQKLKYSIEIDRINNVFAYLEGLFDSKAPIKRPQVSAQAAEILEEKIITFKAILLRVQEKEALLRTVAAKSEIAAQVAHDIRSPLASLNSIVHSTKGLDESTRIQLRTAAQRIRDIANNLLTTYKSGNASQIPVSTSDSPQNDSAAFLSQEPLSVENLSSLIESAVSQKNMQISDTSLITIHSEIAPNASTCFIKTQPTEIHRVLSNLLNNATEACEGGGKVDLTLFLNENQICLTLSDNGKGIPPEILHRIGERGVTFGKPNGNGLGVSHAKAAIESWKGTLSIFSKLGAGTQIKITLPIADRPAWSIDSLKIPMNTTVVISDDDPSIHQIWDQRLADRSDLTLVHLNSPKELLAWFRENLGIDSVLYLCDYEFNGSPQTGVELIEMLNIEKNSILVTSRWEEHALRAQCEKKGIKILPKAFAPTISITG